MRREILNNAVLKAIRFRDGLEGMRFSDQGQQFIDSYGNQRGNQLPFQVRLADGKFVDSTGAFLVGELERLDQTLHMPLADITFGRDVDLREDVTIADEVSSFTLSTFGAQGSLGAGNGIRNGKAWVGKSTDQIVGINTDISKIANPLTPWAMELRFTILELESAARLGRPIDSQKLDGLNLKHQMDTDEQVYVGDATLGQYGLINNTSRVTNISNFANGVGGDSKWTTKTPDEILADVNTALQSVWAESGWAVMPNRILIPPAKFGYLSTQKVSQAGNTSILTYILENNIIKASGRGTLEILPLKWCIGAGAGGTLGTENTVDRSVVYTKEKDKVRFPMTMLQRTPVQFQSIYHLTTYFCRMGVTEIVRPECIGYFDGL